MVRNISGCIFTLAVVLLFSSDASACGRRRANSCDCGYGSYGTSYGYGGSGYGSGYGYGGYGYGRGYGYNPGGIGGPASGLGVRPGAGVGGLGPRR
jgi:hypothetical protein